MKTYKGNVTSLTTKQFFVFGSNTQGRHGKGSALLAKERFGAIYGQASGFQGNTYAIVTKDLSVKPYKAMSKEFIIKQIETLYEHAREMSDCEFLVAYAGQGTNLNGYTPFEMAEMFNTGDIPVNMVFEEQFYKIMPAKSFNPEKRDDESVTEWLARLTKEAEKGFKRIEEQFVEMKDKGIVAFCSRCGSSIYKDKVHEC